MFQMKLEMKQNSTEHKEREQRIYQFLNDNPILKISNIEKEIGLSNGRIKNAINTTFIDKLETYLKKYGYDNRPS